MGSYMTKRRGALIGVSTGEGGSPQRVDTARNTARAAAGRFKDRRLLGARRPLPTRRHGEAHRTTLLAILHSRKGGLYATVRTGAGFSPAPRDESGPEGQKVYAQGGTGEL